MKIAFISHVYLVSENQKKLSALTRYAEIFLITPPVWRDYIFKKVKMNEKNIDFKYFKIPAFFYGNEMRYFFKSITLNFNRIKPDFIVVDNGISLVYLQSIITKKIFLRNSKIGFFTWVNTPLDSRLIKLIKNFCLKNTDFAIFGNSDAAKIHLRKFSFPYIILPQLGVDLEHFENAKPAQIEVEGFVIGYAGRIIKEKGIYTIIDAAKKLEFKTTVLFVGAGEESENIKNYAKKCGVKLKIIPPVPHRNMPEILKKMDVFVLASITTDYWKEQFGHVIIEAMAAGVPVIGSSSGEIPNVIKDAGIIFRENNVDELICAIKKIHENKSFKDTLIEKGKKRVIENFTHDAVARKIIDFFSTL